MNIKTCIDKNYLIKIEPDKELSSKELKESKYDFESAKTAFNNSDFKWCIVKSYYSMFHSAKAILYKLGYREKKHIAILIVLEELNKNGILESKHITNFKASMSAREEADYHYSYTKEIAEYELGIAKEFLKEIEILLKREIKLY